MAAARTADPQVVRAVTGRQRTFLLHELRNLELLRDGRSVVVTLLLSAAAKHVAADLAFLDDAEQTLLADDGAVLATLRAPATGVDPEDAAPVERSNRAESS